MEVKKIIKNTALPTAIMSGLFLSVFLVGQPAHAAKNDLGTDVSKFQPQLTNNSGNDKFSIAQVGGSVHGWTYEQAPYSNQIYQGQAMNYHMHNYIWLETGANQTQTKAALDHFLSEIKTPYGSIVAIDYEAGATGDKEANTANAIYAMQLVRQAGFTPMLYSYKPYLQSHINVDEVLKQFPNSIWVAGYQRSGSTPNYNAFPSMNGVSIWQYQDDPRDLDVDLTGITDNGYTKNTNDNPANEPIAEPQPVKPDNKPVTSKWNPVTYTVQSGDTLTSISCKTGDKDWTIVLNNPNIFGGNLNHTIYPGQKLLVNNNHVSNKFTQYNYVVKPGDTLSGISYKLGDRMDTVIANNTFVFKHGMNTRIYPGQVIHYYR